jgi:hypothetical protein
MVDLIGNLTMEKCASITTILLIVETILVVNTMIYLLPHVDFMILKISLLPENVVHVVEEALELILKPVKCLPGHNRKISREAEMEREDGTNQWDLCQQRSETE